MKNAIVRLTRLMLVLGLSVMVLQGLTGCNMVKGAGKDLQSMGEAGEEAIHGDDEDRD